MENYELQIKLAEMRRKAREDANVSQEKLAQRLGVSKKSVQNWESGECSPSEVMSLEWFHALGLSPLRYYLQFLYPDTFEKIETDKDVENALIACIRGCSPKRQKKLLYMFTGNHGGSPLSMIELIVTHLHLPLHNRVYMAQSLLNYFEIAQAREELRNTDEAMPDIDLLRRATFNSKQAALRKSDTYNNKDKEEDYGQVF